MGRWDQDKRSGIEILGDFRNLQLRLLHCRDKRKRTKGFDKVIMADLAIKELYQDMRELYERNRNRFYDILTKNEATGFECFAWFLMLSDETQKRFR